MRKDVVVTSGNSIATGGDVGETDGVEVKIKAPSPGRSLIPVVKHQPADTHDTPLMELTPNIRVPTARVCPPSVEYISPGTKPPTAAMPPVIHVKRLLAPRSIAQIPFERKIKTP